jgi:hypothetical protein
VAASTGGYAEGGGLEGLLGVARQLGAVRGGRLTKTRWEEKETLKTHSMSSRITCHIPLVYSYKSAEYFRFFSNTVLPLTLREDSPLPMAGPTAMPSMSVLRAFISGSASSAAGVGGAGSVAGDDGWSSCQFCSERFRAVSGVEEDAVVVIVVVWFAVVRDTACASGSFGRVVSG